MKAHVHFGLFAAIVLAAVSLTVLHAQEDIIHIESTGLYPEGIEYDAAHDRFLVGSLTQGTIFEVHGDGAPTPFIEDTELPASVGIHIDTAHDRLLVAGSDTRLFLDPTLPSFAVLAAYDLETGERLFLTDLQAVTDIRPNLANDVTVDADGNAYVTDSFASVIYRVDMDGQASIFSQDERLSAPGGAGLNGIEYHPDGYLLVPMAAGQGLYKIPVDDPAAMTSVELAEPLIGGDGVILHPDGRLIVVSGQTHTVYALRSDDGWDSAVIDGTFAYDPQVVASTAAIRNGEVYILYAHLEAMMMGAPAPDVYEVVHAEFVSP